MRGVNQLPAFDIPFGGSHIDRFIICCMQHAAVLQQYPARVLKGLCQAMRNTAQRMELRLILKQRDLDIRDRQNRIVGIIYPHPTFRTCYDLIQLLILLFVSRE